MTVRDPDTVIVAARRALGELDSLLAYVCQPERTFRDVQYLGFYTQRAIDPRFPRIVGLRRNVLFTREEAARLQALGDDAARFADVIQRALDLGTRIEGLRYEILLLSLEDGFQLRRPIMHPVEVGRSAWVRGQRYTRRDALEHQPQPRTTAELAELGG
jgi:hypothetical protein